MRIGTLLLPALLLVAAPVPAGDTAGDALAPLPASAWTPDHAAHLLRRAGFGGTLADVKALHALGLEQAVETLLDWDGKPDAPVGSPQITLTSRPGRDMMMAAATNEERQEIRREYQRKNQFQYVRVREWWMQSMVRTKHPLRERLVLYWHGHFTSSYRDVRNSYHMYMQNTLFRRHAAGNFRTLLHEISRDPAMLEYLDNNRNRKAHPNENYAREVMELFTLGVGNYSEDDIKAAARALTGWTFAGNRFYFDRRQHDEAAKTFLGRSGKLGGEDVLNIILEQPAASRFLAARLYKYFAHPFPDERVVEGLAKMLRKHDWELRPMLRQLFRSRAFYSRYAMGTKIKSPVEFIVGLYRTLGMDSSRAYGLSLQAQMLGQGLMEPPNVKGWPGGREWITTSHLLNRYNVAGATVGLPIDKRRAGSDRRAARYARLMEQMRRTDPNGEEMDGMGDGMAADEPRRRGRRGARYQPPVYDVVAAVRGAGLKTADEIVSFFTKTLLVNPPSEEMKKTLLAYLERNGAFSLDVMDVRARLHGLLRLIVSTPEFQLT